MDLKTTTEYVIEVAKEAGEILLEFYQTDLDIITKTNSNDLVSEADLTSEKHIIARLQERFPLFGILAEESGTHDSESEYTWIIDPLDGTTNFLHHLDIWSVNIALEHKGEVVIGVTHCPKLNKTYHAYKGGGAFLENEPIQVSKVDKVSQSLLITGFPYKRKGDQYEQTKQFVINALDTCKALRRFGSAAHDLALVAEGNVDGYFEFGLKPYDVAAGVLLVQEAGGKVSSADGDTIDIHAQNIIASNGQVHQDLTSTLNKPLS